MRKNKLGVFLGAVAATVAVTLLGCGPRVAPPATQVLHVAALTDLTSYTSEYGLQERAGLEALAGMSGQGDLPKLDFTVQDTKGTPKDGVAALNQVLQSGGKPDALFVALSSVSMATLPVADRNNLVVLCNATSPQVIQASKNSIRNFPDPEREIDLLIRGAAKPLGLKSVAMIYINDEYGQSMAKYLSTSGAAATGVKVPMAEPYGFDTTDFRPTVGKLVAARADAVICPGYGSQVGSLIRQLREGGFKGRILIPALIVNTESVMKAAGPGIEGVIYNGFDYQQDSSELKTFMQKFRGEYGGKQSDIGVLAYVGMRILATHIGKQGDPASTLGSLSAASPFSTILGSVELKNRSLVYPLKLYVIQNGQSSLFAPPEAR